LGTINKFEEIEAWQKAREARELNKELYKITGDHAFSKDFSLKDQIRGISV